ncbi:MAG TPA: carboxypeptidase-like regulatory domain-containing protein [Gemmatimonadaceae bacterium]|nr:carboxypeptidase-like regulatory domain-containing protein [Gemmatimonadaceae bacterium]
MSSKLGYSAIACWLLTTAALPAGAQTRHEIIRGRITTDSGRTVAGATVRSQRAPDRAQRSASTDAAGAYVIDWPDGTGDYLVSVSAPGLPPMSRRLTRGAGSTDSVLVFDALLTNRPRVQQLPTVVSQAQRSSPTRNDDPEIGGTTANSPTYRRAPPDLVGDIAALTALVPGVVSTPAGNSVLGLAPSQNSVTMNGMSFAGGQIPRDARMRVAVSASSYDPSNGWFSGARTNVFVASSELFSQATGHLLVDAPSLQSTDPVSARLGQRYTNVNGSLGMSGEILDDKFDYSFGLQGGRRSANVASLISADSYVLQRAGVASDSVSRFLHLLQNAQVPTVAGAPSSSLNDNVVFLGRLDHARYNWQTLQPSRTTWGLIGYGSYTHNQAQGLSPVGTPSHAGENTQQIGALTGEYSFYFGHDYLGDVRSGVTLNHSNTQPYLQLPDGRVLVTSAFDDGSAGTTPLAFGGNAGMHTDTRQWTWESIGELQFYPAGAARHRIKLTADSRLDGYTQDLFGNQLGTFSFNSLTDLAANAPASFTRTLNAPTRRGGEWNGYVAVGDLWRVNQNLQVMYGARLEGSAFTDAPAFNPAVESALGARTNVAPAMLHVSPRLGFTLNRPGAAGRPSGSIRGGIGEFRNLLDPALLSTPSVSTGLPGGLARLTCIGGAVPAPNWSAYEASTSAIPTQCVGTPVSSYTDAAPSVQVVDPSYQPQRSWRANLAWTSGLWGRSIYVVEGISSLNLNQPGTVDLNFAGAQRFATADEGRPVYANAASIVPTTGVVSSVDARKTSAFGRVASSVSDLTSYTNQLRLSFRPDLFKMGLYFRDPTVWYVLSDMRAQQRGFNGSTFGDPAARAWGRGDLDARHQFTVQTVFWPRGTKPGPGFFFYGHVQSGLPYTPMVGSDVNGDGLVDDRAFIFDPSKVSDPALASGLQALQRGSAKSARECIARQLGAAAARNSCEGPWTASLNLNVIVNGGDLSRSLERFQLGLNFTNPLSGIDELVHGASRLHGWGAAAQPDPVLYNVRGFDPATNRFAYQVNPRFGSTSPSTTTLRAPFRLTLDVTMDLARPLPDQQLDRWLRPGRGGRSTPKLTADQLTQRLQRNVPDPYGELLQQTDSLLLTADQVTRLQAARTAYRARIDAGWRDLGRYLEALPEVYSFGEVSRHTDDVIDRAWELTRLEVREQYPKILASEQLTILPGWSNRLFQAERPLHVRLFVQ